MRIVKILRFVLSAMFIALITNFIGIAQTEEKISPKTIIGVEVSAPLPTFDYNTYNNIGGDIFLGRHFDFLAKNGFLSATVGYMHYKDGDKIRDDYSVTLGLFGFSSISESDFSYHSGLAVGILQKSQKSYYDNNNNFYESSDGIKAILDLKIGINCAIPLVKSDLTRFHINTKIRYNFNDKECSSILSIGITQLF